MSWSLQSESGGEQPYTRSSHHPIFKYLGGLFILIGVSLLVGSSWLYDSTRRFIAGAATAKGTVTKLVRREGRDPGDSPTYAPSVRFQTSGGRPVDFVSSGSSNPPAYSVGDEVRVLYDPDHPNQASIDGFFSLWGAVLILGVLGAVFTAVGGILVGVHVRGRLGEAERSRQRVALEELRQFGRKVDAKFQEVRPGLDHTFHIVAQWHDPVARKVYVFESEPIGFGRSDFVTGTVPVFIDPGDPHRYLVDTSSLPSMGNVIEPEELT